jgi:hypothetical protein
MNHPFSLILLVMVTGLVGCHEQIGDYRAAAAISQNGFARNGQEMRQMQGQEIKVWGFVDHHNVYGDAGAKQILQEWWSGDGPSTTTWSFKLQGKADAAAGESFLVRVPNDQGRDDILRVLLADARAQRPTKVFVKGRLFTFEAPTNAISQTGIYLELQSSQDILFKSPEAE